MTNDLGLSIVSVLMLATMLSCHREASTSKVERDATAIAADVTEPVHAKGWPAPQVTWEIESVPPNATVFDLASKQALGQTPWRLQQSAGQQLRKVRIEKSGYEPLDLDLSLDRSERRTLVLRLQIL